MMSFLADTAAAPEAAANLPERAELYRLDANRQLSPQTQAALGQFMTPLSVAEFMATMFRRPVTGIIRLLDPGAGVGSLTAVFIHHLLRQEQLPEQIQADLFEIDPILQSYLAQTVPSCQKACAAGGVEFTGRVLAADFVAYAVEKARFAGSLFDPQPTTYTHCIMNPPYKKIRNDSQYRQKLRQAGIETSNLYAGFLALAVKLLAPDGELAAIVPRSFCNGPYFQKFRQFFLQEMALKQIHLFEARNKAFQDDGVLQENVILYAVRGAEQGRVLITASSDAAFADMTRREAHFAEVVRPDDPVQVIRLAATEFEASVVARIDTLPCSLDSLGIAVSTGP
ncbi:MAG TPA: SAM-dependent methyltransferase, partial [Anaerolineae bacterium]|nr:SAM-dependent methyltransferase [Anaerolineae bacterium]